ncbi:MAG: hypothetical protein O2904_02195 [bacterium]|nr:hypothetical protein [bacterium]
MQIFIILIFLALILLAFVALKLRKRVLSHEDKKKIVKMWKSLNSINDPALRILEADSIFDKALGMLGYTGSVADKLKAVGPRIGNVNAVWSVHKMRNRIAHEPGTSISEAEAKRAVSVFKNAIDHLS